MSFKTEIYTNRPRHWKELRNNMALVIKNKEIKNKKNKTLHLHPIHELALVNRKVIKGLAT